MGVKIIFSSWFVDSIFPAVFKTNRPNISHKIRFIILGEIRVFITLIFIKTTNKNTMFNSVDTSSNRYISASDCSRPPHTILYGIILNITSKWKMMVKEKIIISPFCANFLIKCNEMRFSENKKQLR